MLSHLSKLVPRASSRLTARVQTRVTAKKASRVSLARAYTQKFTKTHEWVKIDGGVGTIGITGHAAEALGEIVFVDLPKVGASFKAGNPFGAVESVKAASDIYTPVSGEVVEINKELTSKPDTVNNEPTTGGWMIKMKLSNPKEADSLLDLAAYEKHAAEDKH